MDVPARIQVEGGERAVLTWEDGSVTSLTARTLRAACPCAVCREEAGRAATRAVVEGSAPVRIADAGLVGAYAVKFAFEPDGHTTGIYSFDALKSLEDRVWT